MAQDKKKKISNNREVIDLKKFMLLNNQEQDDLIIDTLNKVYEEEIKVSKKHIEKVLNVAFDAKDTQSYLPNSLCVEKEGNKLNFFFRKNNNLGLLIVFLLAFLFIAGFSTYAGVQYLSKSLLNQDLDGDGVADLNIDLNDDGVCDINCDTNKDGKPDQNIDFHGNRKPIFNVLREDNTIFNPINQDIDGNGVCDINCDTNDDGWPDLNIDYDGDGVVDFDRDIDGDGIKDLDLDLNGDGVCDINCDEDKDDKCDKNCTNANISNNGNGTSSSNGGGVLDVTSADLVVLFESTDAINATNIYPDDQEGTGVPTKIPDMKFTVENTTDNVLYYTINWQDVYNTFESDNFHFMVTSDNNGYRQGWAPVAKSDVEIATRVAIAPRTKQSYTVSFTLHGTGEEQNYDQGKTFRAKVAIDLLKNEN